MKKNRKIIIIPIVFILLILIFILVYLNLNKKTVLYCYKESNYSSDVIQFMSYEVFKSKDEVHLSQENGLLISESTYDKLIKNGYDSNFLNNYFEQALENEFNNKFKKIKDSIKYKTEVFNNRLVLKTDYYINFNNKQEFLELFKFDFYKSDINEIIKYYESGGMLCEKK